MFYISLCMLALGSGGVRGALPALGGDQFDQKDPKEAKALASYFNRLLLCITIGAAIGVTGIVWVSTKKNWYWGFFISTVAAFVGFGFLAVGKSLYRLRAPGESPIVRITQVSLSLSLSLSLFLTHTHTHTRSYTKIHITPTNRKPFCWLWVFAGYCYGNKEPEIIIAREPRWLVWDQW